MVNRFKVTELFDSHHLSELIQNFGLKRMEQEELSGAIQAAFNDYILSALSELSSQGEDKTKVYIEASHHLTKAKKLLEGMPHPAGKMSYRLTKMTETLDKLIQGKTDFAADRANRFMEKNLVRKLRDIWCANTATPFYPGSDGSGKTPRDFLLECFKSANQQYPEITWFNEIDYALADSLIKSIKR